jgi:hypothetical protein
MAIAKFFATGLLLAIGARAQFGPSVTASSTSLGPAPTESIGCRVVGGAWECSAPRTASASSSSSAVQMSSESPTSTTPTETSGSSSGVPAPPAESAGCVLHIDHYHCEGPAEGYEETTATGTAEPTIPSPTESSNCIWRKSKFYGLHHAHYQISVIGTASTQQRRLKRLPVLKTQVNVSYTVSNTPFVLISGEANLQSVTLTEIAPPSSLHAEQSCLKTTTWAYTSDRSSSSWSPLDWRS